VSSISLRLIRGLTVRYTKEKSLTSAVLNRIANSSPRPKWSCPKSSSLAVWSAAKKRCEDCTSVSYTVEEWLFYARRRFTRRLVSTRLACHWEHLKLTLKLIVYTVRPDLSTETCLWNNFLFRPMARMVTDAWSASLRQAPKLMSCLLSCKCVLYVGWRSFVLDDMTPILSRHATNPPIKCRPLTCRRGWANMLKIFERFALLYAGVYIRFVYLGDAAAAAAATSIWASRVRVVAVSIIIVHARYRRTAA